NRRHALDHGGPLCHYTAGRGLARRSSGKYRVAAADGGKRSAGLVLGVGAGLRVLCPALGGAWRSRPDPRLSRTAARSSHRILVAGLVGGAKAPPITYISGTLLFRSEPCSHSAKIWKFRRPKRRCPAAR